MVQERLGHSDIGVTLDIYSYVTPTLGRDAAQRLDEVFDGDAAGDRSEADGTSDADDSAPAPGS